MTPLLTAPVHDAMTRARRSGHTTLECSLDLGRSQTTVICGAGTWSWQEQEYPYPERVRDRTVYYWSGTGFAPVARYSSALIKLVPTAWGPPTFEIDGVKMLPTARVSPYEDAQRKVALVGPRGGRILDTCGGLGYFAAWALAGGAQQVCSYETSADVLWLRSLNPWSPAADPRLHLAHGDVAVQIAGLATASFDAALHDPPRFGLAGELYGQQFYDQLARVLRPRGRLFHYTGTPNRLTSGRDVPNEVARRLQRSGFNAQLEGDGVLATRRASTR